jgi:hypothetical protein
MIGKNAFQNSDRDTVIFASGSRLREIGEGAFSRSLLKSFTVATSVECLGDRCFESCNRLATVTFEEPSRLKKIGERAFAFCSIKSFTIPASVNEMNGSAFLGCPLEVIDIAEGNQSFTVRGNALLTWNGGEIVKYFGLEQEIVVPMEVEVLHNSCFALLGNLTKLKIESGSKLRRIGRYALTGCESLRRILLPSSLSEIEESAFSNCIGLEECSVAQNAMLVRIGQEAFAGCSCLRSFYVPKNVESIGENSFKRCPSLSRLKFGSGEPLKRFVRDMTLDEALKHLGFREISNLFRIEVEDNVSDLSFRGWDPVADDESSHLTLARRFS